MSGSLFEKKDEEAKESGTKFTETWNWFLRSFRSHLTRSLLNLKNELGPT